MPGCVLHIVGKNLDPAALPHAPLTPYATYRRGDALVPRSARVHEVGGLKCLVSQRPGTDLPGQIDDAVAFLEAHSSPLASILGHPDAEEAYLDFGVELRAGTEHVVVQVDYFPPKLVRLAGALSIGLMLSVYPVTSRDDHEPPDQ